MLRSGNATSSVVPSGQCSPLASANPTPLDVSVLQPMRSTRSLISRASFILRTHAFISTLNPLASSADSSTQPADSALDSDSVSFMADSENSTVGTFCVSGSVKRTVCSLLPCSCCDGQNTLKSAMRSGNTGMYSVSIEPVSLFITWTARKIPLSVSWNPNGSSLVSSMPSCSGVLICPLKRQLWHFSGKYPPNVLHSVGPISSFLATRCLYFFSVRW